MQKAMFVCIAGKEDHETTRTWNSSHECSRGFVVIPAS